jgi:hypothetical protein
MYHCCDCFLPTDGDFGFGARRGNPAGNRGLYRRKHPGDQKFGQLRHDVHQKPSDLEGVAILERKDLIGKIGTETKLQQSGLINEETAVELGRIAGVNYMLLGTVTPTDKMSATRKEEVDTYKDKHGNVHRTVTRKVNETHDVSVVITARIVDVETSQVVWSGSESSEANTEYKSYDSSSYYNGISNTLVASIVSRLAEESAYFLSYKLRQEFADDYTYVIEQNGSDFIVDAGTSHGVANGMVFLVYAEGREIKDRKGKVLGTEPIIIAALKVKNVQGPYSVCSVAKPSLASTIRVGDRVEPIRFKRSSKLKYPKKRPDIPKPKSSLFDEVMQTLDSGSTNTAVEPQEKAPQEKAPASAPEPEPAPAPKPEPKTEPASKLDPEIAALLARHNNYDNAVTFYERPKGGSGSWSISVNAPFEAYEVKDMGFSNDELSSVRLNRDKVVVELYQDSRFNSKKKTIGPGRGLYDLSDFDNKTSSYKIIVEE